jgi:hypothetical protein
VAKLYYLHADGDLAGDSDAVYNILLTDEALADLLAVHPTLAIEAGPIVTDDMVADLLADWSST